MHAISMLPSSSRCFKYVLQNRFHNCDWSHFLRRHWLVQCSHYHSLLECYSITIPMPSTYGILSSRDCRCRKIRQVWHDGWCGNVWDRGLTCELVIADLAPRLHEDSNTIVSIVPIPAGFWITKFLWIWLPVAWFLNEFVAIRAHHVKQWVRIDGCIGDSHDRIPLRSKAPGSLVVATTWRSGCGGIWRLRWCTWDWGPWPLNLQVWWLESPTWRHLDMSMVYELMLALVSEIVDHSTLNSYTMYIDSRKSNCTIRNRRSWISEDNLSLLEYLVDDSHLT